jgi:hypothetical protein
MAVDELAHRLRVSHGFGHTIIYGQRVFHKVCESWVPKHLTGDHKCKRLTICQGLHNEGDIF